ncbi:MAG: diguanylate cyclase [Pseudomonadota bacterium]|nr:diguanylate cyclase [Pseudomonadota bacterium]
MPVAQLATLLVLGPAGRQRVRTSQTLLSLAVFLVFALILQAAVLFELAQTEAARVLTTVSLSSAGGFYLLIRSGLNEALHPPEPSLTLAQMVCAITEVCWAYAVLGAARGVVIVMLMVVLTFGMFVLRAGQARAMALLAGLLLAVVMVACNRADPQRHPAEVEIVHAGIATLALGAVSILMVRFGRLRQRLSDQREELRQALAKIHEMATRDELTGLPNRRTLRDQLDQGSQGGQPLSLVLIDIDHFKRINDEHGHPVGDRALCHFARLAEEELRGSTDVVGRWGGEEFLLLLPETAAVPARACVDRLRQRLRCHPLPGVQPPLVLSFSAGITQCASPEDVEAAIERADQAMYRAKEAGRARTELG